MVAAAAVASITVVVMAAVGVAALTGAVAAVVEAASWLV
jgi:hypothetical protein